MRYVGNFSGCKADVPAIAESLNTTYAAYPLRCRYNGNGANDMAHDEHVELCADKFIGGEDFASGQNRIFVAQSKPRFVPEATRAYNSIPTNMDGRALVQSGTGRCWNRVPSLSK